MAVIHNFLEVMKKAKKYKRRMQRLTKDMAEHEIAVKKMQTSTSKLEDLRNVLGEVQEYENATVEELEKSLATKKEILKTSDVSLSSLLIRITLHCTKNLLLPMN